MYNELRSNRAIQKWSARNARARIVYVPLQRMWVPVREYSYFPPSRPIKIENYIGQTQRHLRESTYWIDECHIQTCLCIKFIPGVRMYISRTLRGTRYHFQIDRPCIIAGAFSNNLEGIASVCMRRIAWDSVYKTENK